MRTHPLRIGLLLACAGCASQSVADLPPALRTASFASVQNPRYAAIRPASFAWLKSSMLRPDPRVDAAMREELTTSIRAELTRALEARGFVNDDSARAEYLVGYVGALGRSVRDDEVDAQHGVRSAAEATGGTRNHADGSLVVDVVDRKTRSSMWRGSVDALVGLGLDPGTRRERMRLFAETLIGQMTLTR